MPLRRHLLADVAVALAVGVAGCVDGGSDGEADGDGEGDGADGGDADEDANGGQATGSNGEGADDEATGDPPVGETETAGDSAVQISTPAFEEGESIPSVYTCDGPDVSPPLSIESVPEDAGALAIVVDDPDAPDGPFTHWTVWNVPPATAEVPEGIATDPEPDELGGGRQGENDFGEVGYRGPCPPEGGDPHRYRFSLHALEDELDLEAGAGVEAARDGIADATISTAEYAGVYGR